MKLWEEILEHTFSSFQFDAERIIELQCYQVVARDTIFNKKRYLKRNRSIQAGKHDKENGSPQLSL